MIFVSVDLETTGLNPDTCDIVEFAAQVYSTQAATPVETWPFLHCYMDQEEWRGETYALSMHAEAFHRIAAHEPGYLYIDPQALGETFQRFLTGQNILGKVTVAGKNFGAFDLQFLRRFPYIMGDMFHHRSLDPAMMFFQQDDTEISTLQMCLNRAGLDTKVQHTALEDARDVAKLIWWGLKER